MIPFPLYGHGLSEHRFDHVLRRNPRDDLVISTKAGRAPRPQLADRMERGWFKGDLNFARGGLRQTPLEPHWPPD